MTDGTYKINFLGDGRIKLKDKIYVDENRPRVLGPLEHDKYKSHKAEVKEAVDIISWSRKPTDNFRNRVKKFLSKHHKE